MGEDLDLSRKSCEDWGEKTEFGFLGLKFVLCAHGSRDKGELNMARAALVSSSAHVSEEGRRGRCAVNRVDEGISYGGFRACG